MKTTAMFLLAMMAYTVVTETTTTANGCLADAALTAWGYTGTGKATKETEPTFCTNLYKDDGSCVAAGGFEKAIDYLETRFGENTVAWKNIDDTFTSFFKDVKGVLSDLWNKVTSSEKKDTLTWEEQMGKAVKDGEDHRDTCFKNYNEMQHGIACLVSSAKASSFVTVSGSEFTISVDNNLLQIAKDCMPILSATCLYFKGTEEAQVDVSQNAQQKAYCVEVNNYKDCMDKGGTDTTCLNNDRSQKIVMNIFPSQNLTIFPAVAAIESTSSKIKAKFTEIKDKAFSWIKSVTSSNRILDLATGTTIVLKFSSTGANLKSYGENSGKTIKSTSIFSVLTTLSVIMLAFL